jgi:hypothetical protein
MPKMIVSIDGVVVKEVQITKERTTLGRRPYNDVVIDNLAVSGEHAVITMAGTEVSIEDLNSTNGTYINGKAVKRHVLQHNDTVEVGKYKIRYSADAAEEFEKTTIFKSSPGGAPTMTPPLASVARAAPPVQAAVMRTAPDGEVRHGPAGAAAIRVLNGASTGREVPLVKVVTTLGKPGMAVASITRRPHGYVLAYVEGQLFPTLNGQQVGAEPVTLKSGDVVSLAGTQMQFVQG